MRFQIPYSDLYFWIIIALLVVITGLLFYNGRNKKNSLKLLLYITGSICIILGLAAFILQPQTSHDRTDSKIFLHTAPYNELSYYDSRNSYSYKNEALADSLGIPLILELNELSLQKSDSLIITGFGLDGDDLLSLKEFNYKFIGEEAIEGLLYLQAQAEVSVLEEHTISFVYQHKDTASLKITLSGPGGTEDSVNLSGVGKHFLQLKISGRNPGNYLYKLTILDEAQQIIARHSLPVSIQQEEQLKLLLINAYPSAESRYLKNWLGEKKHQLYVRTFTSRNLFTDEKINIDDHTSWNLNQALLDELDLVILSAQVFNQLDDGFISNLLNTVEDNGLNIHLLWDEPIIKHPQFSRMLRENFASISRFSSPRPFTYDASGTNLKKKATIESIGRFVEQKAPVNSLDELFYAIPYGLGNIGLSFLSLSYPLILSGEADLYSALWTELLTNSMASAPKGMSIFNFTPLRENSPGKLQIIADGLPNTQLIGPDHKNYGQLQWRQDAWNENLFSTLIVPKQNGWHSLVTVAQESSETDSLHFYVHENDAYSTIMSHEKHQTNQHLRKHSVYKTNDAATIMHYQTVDYIWFYMLLVAGLFLLWLEPKL